MDRDGFEPDRDRPLRRDPVHRDETRIERHGGSGNNFVIMTMPLGTYHWEELSIGRYSSHLAICAVADPVLWQPVINELAIQIEHEFTILMRNRATLWNIPPDTTPEERRTFLIGEHELPIYTTWIEYGREYDCEQCGKRFFGRRIHLDHQLRLCSDKCMQTRRALQQKRWRETSANNPNLLRSQTRAEIRSNRQCECCGKPFESPRSTRKFCSNRCRVAAHRAISENSLTNPNPSFDQ